MKDELPGPLYELLREAAHGRFPDPVGQIDVMGPPSGPVQGVASFTAHSVVATSIAADEVRSQLPGSHFGAPLRIPFLAWLGDRLGRPPGVVCVVLARVGQPSASAVELMRLTKWSTHPRVARALDYRQEVRAYADKDERGVVLLGRGLARRWEIGIELEPDHRARGLGKEIVAAAMAFVPPGEPVFAQIPAGNARSIRTFLSLGFQPIGAEVLYTK